jgi:signal peptidase I
MASNDRVQVLSERTRIPADGVSSAKLCLRFQQPEGENVTLKLSRAGSFLPDSTVREMSFPVQDGEVNLTVYSPSRPATTLLVGPGIKQRLEFGAASHLHAVVYEWIPTLLWALVLALVLRNYAVASYFIPSGSMEDTLKRGDLLIADKFSFKALHHEPERGDVMIFVYPDTDKSHPKVDYIKRIIGLPGDTVEVSNGTVYVNSEPLDEPYIKEHPFNDFAPRVVGPNEYFAMGDNRNHSSDSRVWGFVPRKNLEGRALFVFWPFTRAKILPRVAYPAPPAATEAASRHKQVPGPSGPAQTWVKENLRPEQQDYPQWAVDTLLRRLNGEPVTDEDLEKLQTYEDSLKKP